MALEVRLGCYLRRWLSSLDRYIPNQCGAGRKSISKAICATHTGFVRNASTAEVDRRRKVPQSKPSAFDQS